MSTEQQMESVMPGSRRLQWLTSTPISTCFLAPGRGARRVGDAGHVAQPEVSDGEAERAEAALPPPADGVPLAGEVERVHVLTDFIL